MKDNQTLIGACSRFGNPVRWYDDGIGPLWLYRDAGGYTMLVRARTWADALAIVYDEMPPVEPGDLPEAYGLYVYAYQGADTFGVQYDFADGRYSARMFSTRADACAYALRLASRLDLNLAEGYQYQSNATGTGIVSVDLNGESLELYAAGDGGVIAIIETDDDDD